MFMFVFIVSSANARFKDEGVFLFDPHTLGVLTEEQADTVLLVAFCEKGGLAVLCENSFED